VSRDRPWVVPQREASIPTLPRPERIVSQLSPGAQGVCHGLRQARNSRDNCMGQSTRGLWTLSGTHCLVLEFLQRGFRESSLLRLSESRLANPLLNAASSNGNAIQTPAAQAKRRAKARAENATPSLLNQPRHEP
jgi:hypothetical protein